MNKQIVSLYLNEVGIIIENQYFDIGKNDCGHLLQRQTLVREIVIQKYTEHMLE